MLKTQKYYHIAAFLCQLNDGIYLQELRVCLNTSLIPTANNYLKKVSKKYPVTTKQTPFDCCSMGIGSNNKAISELLLTSFIN